MCLILRKKKKEEGVREKTWMLVSRHCCGQGCSGLILNMLIGPSTASFKQKMGLVLSSRFYPFISLTFFFLPCSPFVSLTLFSRSDFGPDKRAALRCVRKHVSRYTAPGLKYRPVSSTRVRDRMHVCYLTEGTKATEVNKGCFMHRCFKTLTHLFSYKWNKKKNTGRYTVGQKGIYTTY